MARLAFDPHVHSFHFPNDFASYGPFNTDGLCGGMCLAAFNYFRYAIPIPYYTKRDMDPYFAVHYDLALSTGPNTPMLVDYVFHSQLATFENVSVASFAAPDDPPYQSEALQVKARIDRGEYAILGLKDRTGFSAGHQVLCYGYDDVDNSKLFVYDPNSPDLESFITPTTGADGQPVILVTTETGHVDERYRAMFEQQELFANVTSELTHYDAVQNVLRGLNFAVRPPLVIQPAIGTTETVIDSTATHLDLFWTHTDGSINTSSRDAGQVWDPLSVRTITSQQSSAGGAVAVVARMPGHLDLFWVAPDGSIATLWSDDGISWDPSATFSVSGPNEALGGAVAALARARNHLDLFWIGSDDSIRSTWWDGSTWGSDRSFSIPGAEHASGESVSVVARTTSHLDIFWVTNDGRLRSTWWDADSSAGAWLAYRAFTIPNTAQSVSVPTAISRTPDHLDVFWVDPDGSIKSTWWDAANGWAGRPVDVTPPNTALPGRVSVIARRPDHLDLFWVHPNGSVNSTWWDASVDGGAWRADRIFGVTTPTRAVAGSVNAVARYPWTLEVFWTTRDGSIATTSWSEQENGGAWNSTAIVTVGFPGAVAAMR